MNNMLVDVLNLLLNKNYDLNSIQECVDHLTAHINDIKVAQQQKLFEQDLEYINEYFGEPEGYYKWDLGSLTIIAEVNAVGVKWDMLAGHRSTGVFYIPKHAIPSIKLIAEMANKKNIAIRSVTLYSSSMFVILQDKAQITLNYDGTYSYHKTNETHGNIGDPNNDLF